MSDFSTSNKVASATQIASTTGESSSRAIDRLASPSIEIPLRSVSRVTSKLLEEEVKPLGPDPSAVLPPPLLNPFFDLAFSAQILSLLSEVSLKRSSISQSFEQFQARIMMEMFQAALTEAILEGDKVQKELKKAEEAIKGAIVQMAIALATLAIITAIGAAVGMKAAGSGGGAKATVDDVSTTGSPPSPSPTMSANDPRLPPPPPEAQVTQADGSPRISQTPQNNNSVASRALRPTAEQKAEISLGAQENTAAKTSNTGISTNAPIDETQQTGQNQASAETEETPIKKERWLETLFDSALKATNPLVNIGNSINTLITEQGKKDYYNNILEIDKARASTKTYKDMLELEFGQFKGALKDLDQSLDATIDAIQQVARQSKEMADLAAKRGL